MEIYIRRDEKKMKYKLFLILGLSVLLVGCGTEECDCTGAVEQNNNFHDYYGKAKVQYTFGLVDYNNAEYHYNLWKVYYNDEHFIDSIEHCSDARELYSSSNIQYEKAINYFKKTREYGSLEYNELVDKYILVSQLAMDINNVMYEACEYFELGANYLNKGNIQIGNSEIEKGNNRRLEHDSLFKDYNSYILEIEVIEEDK